MAPLIFALLGSAPLAMLYRAANTPDSVAAGALGIELGGGLIRIRRAQRACKIGLAFEEA